jgi:hypothetical protein
MNDKKTMDDGIQHQETPADEFVDELADEALDRPNESRHCVGGTNYCI